MLSGVEVIDAVAMEAGIAPEPPGAAVAPNIDKEEPTLPVPTLPVNVEFAELAVLPTATDPLVAFEWGPTLLEESASGLAEAGTPVEEANTGVTWTGSTGV